MASLGEAIALGANLGSHEGMLNAALARRDAREAAAEQAKRKAREEAEDKMNKYVSDADFYLHQKWSPIYAPAVKREVADFTNEVIKHKLDNPNAWQSYTYDAFNKLRGRLSELAANNQNYQQFEDAVAKGDVKYLPSGFMDKINKTDFASGLYRDESGNVVSPMWKETQIDPIYGFNLSENGAFSANPVMATGYDKTIDELRNKDENLVLDKKQPKPRFMGNNMYLYSTSSTMKPEIAAQHALAFSNDPNIVREFAVKNADDLRTRYKKEAQPNEDFSSFVQKAAYNDFYTRLMQPVSKQAGLHALPKESGEKEKTPVLTSAGARTLSVGQEFVTQKGETLPKHYETPAGERAYKKKDDWYKVVGGVEQKLNPDEAKTLVLTPSSGQYVNKNITSNDSHTFSSPVSISYTPSEVIDFTGTGVTQDHSGVLNFKVSSIDKLPYFVANGKTYLLTDELKQKGTVEPNRIKTGWFAIGDDDGKSGQTVAVPFTDNLKKTFIDKKIDISAIEGQPSVTKAAKPSAENKDINKLKEKYGEWFRNVVIKK